MRRENLAILISLLSLAISLLSLAWNIFRELGLKARVKVSCVVGTFVSPENRENKIIISVVNFGPGEVHVKGVTLKNTWWSRLRGGSRYFLVLPEWDHPINTRLPAKLDVGGEASLVVPFDKDCFLSSRVARVGVVDTFNRQHWASRKDLRRAREQYRKDFGTIHEPSNAAA